VPFAVTGGQDRAQRVVGDVGGDVRLSPDLVIHPVAEQSAASAHAVPSHRRVRLIFAAYSSSLTTPSSTGAAESDRVAVGTSSSAAAEVDVPALLLVRMV